MNASRPTRPSRYACLGETSINDPSLLRFNQNDDTPPWGNNKRKEKGEDGPEWIVRIDFVVLEMDKDELSHGYLWGWPSSPSMAKRVIEIRRKIEFKGRKSSPSTLGNP
ncbi:hypothetical protein Tco_0522801 [Tanacetum coccineum]